MVDTSITKILGEGSLPEELVNSLQEAFDKKVAEAKDEAETSIREEFASRYEHDKNNLVEAMDRMLTDLVTQQSSEHQTAVQKFVEARNSFRKAIKESRKQYVAKLNENMDTSRKFVTEKLKNEIVKLRENQKTLTKEKLKVAESMSNMKRKIVSEQHARVKKIDEFIIRQLKEELEEFSSNQKALVETRVKLVSESRKRLRDTQARFVSEAAKNAEKVITNTLVSEMKQLHEELEHNRENLFGRRIFEAVAAEYMTSYLNEGSELRKLQNVIEAKNKELTSQNKKLDEALKESQKLNRKASLAEERAIRSKVMSELLSNLRGEKRTVMEGMLETVKTDALRSTFTKLMPVVINEKSSLKATNLTNKMPLTENNTSKVITGDNRSATRLFENAEAETNNIDTDDLARVVRLAGIQK